MREDLAFIKKITEGHHHETKLTIIKAYQLTWINNQTECPVQGENKGRFAANKKVREMIQQKQIPVEQIPHKCCDNCEHIGLNNTCGKFSQKVPDDFLKVENECNEFTYGIPF